MNNTAAYLSQEKHDELNDELNHLKMVERKHIAEQLEYAKSLGDLSENAEYHEARDKQADIESRISEIEQILKSAIIISGVTPKGKVSIGSTVVVKKDGGAESKYIIVGSEEANTLEGKVSHHSPLGLALLDKKKGEEVEVTTPRGKVKYSIIDIK
ncbi:MAG: transcription elongation factor GreA [Candidatus Vogelbacteria bacterium RIFOXYD1_FULL_46_19]|uniref:Transcription elongation factor GreA n=1 Tax=Candidatus Vogelbacteria bacterium RIFOXYD1_FULL_46_19 TaxID=1802439 RepID=A0A1G2QG02_9BACT|nr:MAG: transcription elongation factor GreA [Candidatus Vogelbacteria bacterium RIFOXYD1_FULL_46_19]